jgi:quercetin dioxygenase-like cupin family protein
VEFRCRNLEREEWVALLDERGRELPGIRGKAGVAGRSADGREFGADRIEMEPGTAFPLHTHEGDHILYVERGRGYVHVNGVDHRVGAGDTIFVPAHYPHGVQTDPACEEPFVFLAVGYPHRHVQARDRMTLVEDSGEAQPSGS